MIIGSKQLDIKRMLHEKAMSTLKWAIFLLKSTQKLIRDSFFNQINHYMLVDLCKSNKKSKLSTLLVD